MANAGDLLAWRLRAARLVRRFLDYNRDLYLNGAVDASFPWFNADAYLSAYPEIRKQLLEEGTVGKATLIKSNTYGPSEPKEWMYDVHKNYGPLGEVNSHDFDTVRWYAQSEVKMIHAIGGNFRSQEKAEEYPDYYDTCSVLLEFENGILGVITGAQYVRYGYDSRAEILGTTGIIKVGSQQANNAEAVTSDRVIHVDSMDSWRTLFLDAYKAEDQAFIDCNTEPPVTGTDGKMALILVNESLRSLLEHRPVYLKNGLPEESR